MPCCMKYYIMFKFYIKYDTGNLFKQFTNLYMQFYIYFNHLYIIIFNYTSHWL